MTIVVNFTVKDIINNSQKIQTHTSTFMTILILVVCILILDKKIDLQDNPKLILITIRRICKVILMILFMSLAINKLEDKNMTFDLLVVSGYSCFVMYEYFGCKGKYRITRNKITKNKQYEVGRQVERWIGVIFIVCIASFLLVWTGKISISSWKTASVLIPLITVLFLFVAAGIEHGIYWSVSRDQDMLNASEDLSTTLIIPILANLSNNDIGYIIFGCLILIIIYYKKED